MSEEKLEEAVRPEGLPHDNQAAQETQPEFKYRLMVAMSRHIGRTRAIGMGELFEEIYGESWNHRINDTRKLRKLIAETKEEGVPILSSPAHVGGGYYLSGSDSEMDAFYAMRRKMALKILALEAKMRKLAMPELLGQIAMNL
jgi:hypothetical protein